MLCIGTLPVNESEYISPAELGKQLRASEWTVRRWIEEGKVNAVRIGRRFLIPRSELQRLTEPAAERHRLSRGAVPRYDYFAAPYTDGELDERVEVLVAALDAANWPWDTFELKREGLKKVLLGQEHALPVVWRYLTDGIEALRHRKSPESTQAVSKNIAAQLRTHSRKTE